MYTCIGFTALLTRCLGVAADRTGAELYDKYRGVLSKAVISHTTCFRICLHLYHTRQQLEGGMENDGKNPLKMYANLVSTSGWTPSFVYCKWYNE